MEIGGSMFASSPLRAFFSGAFAALLMASIVAAQDKPSGAPVSSDAALLIPKQNPLAGVRPEKTNVKQESLFDFTLPRLMKPVGLIPSPDRAAGVIGPDVNRRASGALRITLEEAQARAISIHAVILAGAIVDAASYHRKAAQSDYFPKVSANFVNIHYNKLMGDT